MGGGSTVLSPLTILVSGPVAPSTKAITQYSLNGTTGIITGTNIAVMMPYGTALSSLVATYVTTGKTVSVSGVVQDNGVTSNNFTSPVIYTVTAEDGSTQNYTVTVTVAPDSAKAITAFSLNGTNGVISGNNISIEMPYGTSLKSLIATFTTSGESVKVDDAIQVSGQTSNDFTSPVIYTVTAEDGSTQDYTVTVTVAQNSAKAITAFSLDGTNGVISGNNISVEMPYGTNLKSLIATFTTSGESVKVGDAIQVSGQTSNDFTFPVIYTVTAGDGSTQDYTVTVTVAQNSAKAITAFSLNGTNGVISGNNISIEMPYGTSLKSLIATFTTSGESVKVDDAIQVSGQTSNDFTSPVIYTVTAEDGSTQDYTVTVTVAQNSAKAITAFSVNGTNGVISGNNISVMMPNGANVSSSIATFTTTGQSVKVNDVIQVSGQTSNDFTSPVVYTVTAEDGSIQRYTVVVYFYTTSGWFIQDFYKPVGAQFAWTSNPISDNQSTYLSMSVSGTGELSFQWSVSSEEVFDYLELYIDGNKRASISGEVPWQNSRIPIIGSGSHTVIWKYTKNINASKGKDAGFVANISYSRRSS